MDLGSGRRGTGSGSRLQTANPFSSLDPVSLTPPCTMRTNEYERVPQRAWHTQQVPNTCEVANHQKDGSHKVPGSMELSIKLQQIFLLLLRGVSIPEVIEKFLLGIPG